MRRLEVASVCLSVVLVGTLYAANPHFINADAVINKDGSLVVDWKEAGLGDSLQVTYTASADSHVTYQCVNHGGNCPSAANKQELAGPVSATGTFASGKNGQITASLTVDPPPSTLVCPGNQVLKVAAVSYENVLLNDDTNGIAAAIPPNVSKTFFVCP